MTSPGSPERWLQEAGYRIQSINANRNVSDNAFVDLDLGDSAVSQVSLRLRRGAKSNLPILLQGETGTGKELFARAVHYASNRRSGPFVAVNCASIPEGLVESELFGYRAGAFTGASSKGSKGLVQKAQGGTLFLDEVGDMPLALQSRLLRVLAEKEVTPVGSDSPIKADFRVVSATHRSLNDMAKRGEFREDLMFRLHGLAVSLPPLRNRTDIITLAQRLLASEESSVGRRLSLSACAEVLVRQMSWPGNVRQLKQVLTTAAWLTDESTIYASDIETALDAGSTFDSTAECEHDPIAQLSDSSPGEGEKGQLLYSLRRNRWNVSLTAREFNTARTTIYRRMARLGIVQPHLLAN